MKILFLASNPFSSERIALDEEARTIEEKIRRAAYGRKIDFHTRWAVRAQDLQQAFLDLEPDAVHFSGHGTGSAGIVLHGEDGNSQTRTSSKALADLFRVHKGNIRLVVLNACFSEEQATAIVEEIDVVVGMVDRVSDETATVFSAALYQGLASEKSIRAAFDMGLVQLGLAGLESEQDVPRMLVRSGVDADRVSLMTAESAEPVDGVLCYDRADEAVVKAIAGWLEDREELRAWLDDWHLVPGQDRRQAFEAALKATQCCVIFLGPSGLGPWRDDATRAALEAKVPGVRIVPVLLPGAEPPRLESKLPGFLRRLRWVRFQESCERGSPASSLELRDSRPRPRTRGTGFRR